jgi:arylsulfatase A-like enzyme
VSRPPNILLVLTDQLRHPPPYESEGLRRFRREELSAEEGLRESGVSFRRHYVMAAACAPSRASLLTGHYPSLHGVTQTDGVAKDPAGDDMTWLAPDGVPTLGDWFRAGGYRTFYKGKWHASHAQLDGPRDRPLQSMENDGTPLAENVAAYLEADLLDPFGFSEWVGPEPHGIGRRNTGTARDPFTAAETVALLRRLEQDGDQRPWLTVCSFLNPHDIAIYGVGALTHGLRHRSSTVPKVANAPTRDADLSTKPSCQQSYVDVWWKLLGPQLWTETHRRFYYKLQRTVDGQLARVLEALRELRSYEDTIVVFTSDHGDMLGAHGGMHQKWHNAYEETIHVPFVVSSPRLDGGRREVDVPTSHADLLPTLLGLAGIDRDEVLDRLAADHTEARPLVGRDLSPLILDAAAEVPAEPVLFVTDDEISEGNGTPSSPLQRFARFARFYEVVSQPNHIESVVAEVDVDGELHLVKLSRYHDNQQFWTAPGERDERLARRRTVTVTEPAHDEYELYDLTVDPIEERNLAHRSHADDGARRLQERMLGLLVEQLAAKRLAPAAGEIPGYRPPRLS